MKKTISIILIAAMLISITAFFSHAEEPEITLNTLASVTANVGSFDTIEAGDRVFANRTYAFGENLPAYLPGKTYLRTNMANSVNANVMTDGFVYVLTQVDGTANSQETALLADGFARIDTLAANTLWSSHAYAVAVMAKKVHAGDTISFSYWGILIADFAMNALASVSPSNGSFSVIEKGTAIFSNRNYAFGDIPNTLIGRSYLKVDISANVCVTAASHGYIYVLTQVDGTANSQEATLAESGFTKIATIGAGLLWSTHLYEVAVMAKEVEAGDEISYNYWGLLIASEETFSLNALATLTPTYETAGTISAGKQIFTDRTTHVFAATLPDYLLGQNYLSVSMDEGSSLSVTADGWVYIITPAAGNSSSLFDTLNNDGFSLLTSINAKVLSTAISEPLSVMGKEVHTGERVTIGKWGIVVANADENNEFSVNPLDPPSIIQNPASGEYIDGNRLWQGIPGIAKDPKSGRLWATWYSGGEGEGAYNFVLLYTSANDGKSWQGPVIVIDHEFPVRVFDPNLWIDPDGRMWVIWSQSRFHMDGVYGTWMMYTENPESANPVWSAPMRVANGVAMNDPIVLSNGDWLLPTAIWSFRNTVEEMTEEINSNAYISKDKGLSWQYLGSVQSYTGGRNCDENMMIEQADGSLRMLIRTALGIEESYSYDGGATWTGSTDAGITKTVSRFFITRLSSGHQLLVYNDPPSHGNVRSHMTAAISTDDGKTWTHKLVIDARSSSSYPDAQEDEEGNIYIIYDHTRTANGQIMMAKITEADIFAGTLVSETSKLQVLINNNTAPRHSVNAALKGKISLGFFLDADWYKTAKKIITRAPDENGNYQATAYTLNELEKSNGCYQVDIAVAAAQMTENLYLAILDADGDTLYEKQYSVRTYLNSLKQLGGAEELIALCDATLCYGAAAQAYFHYRTDDLANINYKSALTDITHIDAAFSETGSKAALEISAVKVSVLLNSSTGMRFYFTAPEGCYTFSVDGEPISASYENGRYRVVVNNIAAAQLGRTYAVTVGKESNTYTIRYQVLCYAAQVLNAEREETLQDAVKALYLYYKTADAYFSK